MADDYDDVFGPVVVPREEVVAPPVDEGQARAIARQRELQERLRRFG